MVRVGPSVSGGREENRAELISAPDSDPVVSRVTEGPSEVTPAGVPVTLARARFTKVVENNRQQLRSATDFW